MDIKGEGVEVSVDPAEQSDEWLVNAAQEIADVAEQRGLELPFATGVAAVEGAMQSQSAEDAEVNVEATAETLAAAKESIIKQLPFAYQGNQAIISSLNQDQGRKNKDQYSAATEEALANEVEAWLTDEKLAYVANAMEVDPELSFTLVATPNVVVPKKDIVKVAKAFGQGQPYETDVYDSLYDKYTAQQLSGTDPNNGNSVQFSLIPSKFIDSMEGTVTKQRSELTNLQANSPELNFKVPSPLEAETFKQTLRAQGDDLATGDVFNRTYIRHFDLPEQRIDDWRCVPGSFVSDRGQSDLNNSNVRNDIPARVAVG
ncbi:MAG: hypothetical protein AAB971_03475 [Patescibacteria group bacterium]